MVQQLRLGAADMMISGSSIWSQVAPEFGVLDMGYIFNGWDGVGKALDAGAETSFPGSSRTRAALKSSAGPTTSARGT